MKVVFEPPDKDSPGFLKRMKRAISFQDAIKNNQLSEAVVDNMIDFLADFIKEPADKEEAKAYLLDASQAQFEDMLKALNNTEQENDTKKNGKE